MQDSLTSTVSKLLADLDVIDLSIGDPPIDEIIGQVFQAGQV
jgi:ABC-2 type transport system ATP-binding protein